MLYSVQLDSKLGCMGAQLLALLAHSLKIPRLGNFLCGVCMFSLCSVGSHWVLWFPPVQEHLRLIGDSKLCVGVNAGVFGCLSV